MFKNILSELSFEQIMELSDLPHPLISQSTNDSNEDLLSSFVKFITGQTTWDSIINIKIKENSFLEAFTFFAQSQQHGTKISKTTRSELSVCLSKMEKSISDKKSEMVDFFEKLDHKASEARKLADNLQKDLLKINFPPDIPTTLSEVEDLKSLFKKISELENDCKDIIEIADDEIKISRAEFHNLVEKSFDRFFNLLKKDKLIEGAHETDIFRKLPSMIIDRDTDLLSKIADNNQSIQDIEIPGPEKTNKKIHINAIRSISKFHVKSENLPSSPIALNYYSKAIYDSISVLNRKFNNIEDLRREADKKISYDEKARLWLGAAKSNSNTQIVNTMLGEGLLTQGIFYIQNHNYSNARKILIDAFSCIAHSGHHGELSIENSVIAILVAWIWPKYVGENDKNQNGTDWINDPSLMISEFRNGRFFYDIAKIWVDEIIDDDDAFQFLENLSTHIGDDRTLYRFCCERLLLPNIILNKPNMMGTRLKWFLKDANPPTILFDTIDQLILEFSQKNELTKQVRNRTNLNKILGELVEELDRLSADSVAPVHEIKLSLPKLIDNIIKTQSKNKQQIDKPNLTIQPMVKTFYPEELSDELAVPILIKNDENASMATNLVVKLFCRDEYRHTIDIYKNTYEIGDLEPNNFHEAVFFLNLPDDIIMNCTELSFRIQKIMGTSVESDDFTIKIQPGNREYKKSPYTPGSVVSKTNFIGRKNELNRIMSTLTGDSDQNALIIFGNRRIGKTSILKCIEKDFEIGRRYYTIYWDVEDYSESNSSSDFFIDLIEKIVNVLPNKYRSLLYFKRDEIRDQPYAAFEKFVQSIDNSGIDKRILILFDEFDNLLHIYEKTLEIKKNADQLLGPSDIFEQEVFSALRKALMSSSSLSIIFTGLPNLTIQDYQSRLFGLADQIQIKEFEEDEARLVIDVSKNTMAIQPTVREMIIEATGAQPYLLQVICHLLFYKNICSGRDIVAIHDLHEVVDQIISTDSYFKDYISFIKDDIWITLYGLALSLKLRSGKRHYVYANEIIDALLSKGYNFKLEDIKTVLKQLSEDSPLTRSLVKRTKNHYYRFSIGLIGDFILRKEIQ